MALFKVNTGLREQEVCGLKWEYEVKVPELETLVFVIPGGNVKNGEERLVVLNRVAKSVGDCGRRVCRSRIDRTCWAIVLVASRRTTPERNSRA
jgi:hypothetical protein